MWTPGDLSLPSLREIQIRAEVYGQASPETLTLVVDELAAMIERADAAHAKSEELSADVERLEGRVSDLEDDLCGAEDELAEEKKRAEDLDAERRSLVERVEELEARLAEAEERRCKLEEAGKAREIDAVSAYPTLATNAAYGKVRGEDEASYRAAEIKAAGGEPVFTVRASPGSGVEVSIREVTSEAVVVDVRRPEAPSPPLTVDLDPPVARPPYKMAGGKTSLLPRLLARIPDAWRSGGYHEPFAGAAALFWALEGRGRLRNGRVTLCDANPVLVRTLRAIRDNVERVIEVLSPLVYDREIYGQVRALGFDGADDAIMAARFLYLNRTCFNGLWRVNKKGQFNVPFGRYKNPTICDADNLRACSAALRRVDAIGHGTFEDVLDHAEPGDLVYLDPPYVPASKTASFASYTAEKFGDEDHVRLRDVALELKRRGCHVLLSNSDTPRVRELYGEGFVVERVTAPRSISCKGGERRDAGEVIVT